MNVDPAKVDAAVAGAHSDILGRLSGLNLDEQDKALWEIEDDVWKLRMLNENTPRRQVGLAVANGVQGFNVEAAKLGGVTVAHRVFDSVYRNGGPAASPSVIDDIVKGRTTFYSSKVDLNLMAAGTLNAMVTTDARTLSARLGGATFYWTLHHEPENDGLDPALYRAAWTNWAGSVRAAGVPNIQLAFIHIANNARNPALLDQFYPPECDVIGTDGYNWNSKLSTTMEFIFEPSRAYAASKAKPWFIAETGALGKPLPANSGANGNKPAPAHPDRVGWLNQGRAWFDTLNDPPFALCYFDVEDLAKHAYWPLLTTAEYAALAAMEG